MKNALIHFLLLFVPLQWISSNCSSESVKEVFKLETIFLLWTIKNVWNRNHWNFLVKKFFDHWIIKVLTMLHLNYALSAHKLPSAQTSSSLVTILIMCPNTVCTTGLLGHLHTSQWSYALHACWDQYVPALLCTWGLWGIYVSKHVWRTKTRRLERVKNLLFPTPVQVKSYCTHQPKFIGWLVKVLFFK